MSDCRETMSLSCSTQDLGLWIGTCRGCHRTRCCLLGGTYWTWRRNVARRQFWSGNQKRSAVLPGHGRARWVQRSSPDAFPLHQVLTFFFFPLRLLRSQRHFLDEKYQSQKRRCHWDRSPAIGFAHGAIPVKWWAITRFSGESISWGGVSGNLSSRKWWIIGTICFSGKWIQENEPARKVRASDCRSRNHMIWDITSRCSHRYIQYRICCKHPSRSVVLRRPSISKEDLSSGWLQQLHKFLIHELDVRCKHLLDPYNWICL